LIEEELPVGAIDHQSHAGLAPFRVDVHPERDVVRVAAVGELDLVTVAQLQAQIGELRDTGVTHLVLDLRQLTFMDSSGVALILDEDRFARRNGQDFSLISGAPAIQRVLTLCCGEDLLRLCTRTPRRCSMRDDPATAAADDKPVLSLAMRRYVGELRHQARPRRHLST
jgi:anti-anti-sigma factor